VKEGWKATGLLKPLWEKLEPPIAESLSKISAVPTKSLYGYNTGRLNLGMDNAVKIAQACDVSVYDLGAPRLPDQAFLMSLLGQISLELRRIAPRVDPTHLLELADELRGLASDLEAVAAGLTAGGSP
jgi:hypothetical protein